mmetsp:Transcript_11992/g.21716  ORF Transcript_11992/g.21716 Transcript_11992/m.21716 type:complete len:189 (-) Transcript_11992:187-753(-)
MMSNTAESTPSHDQFSSNSSTPTLTFMTSSRNQLTSTLEILAPFATFKLTTQRILTFILHPFHILQRKRALAKAAAVRRLNLRKQQRLAQRNSMSYGSKSVSKATPAGMISGGRSGKSVSKSGGGGDGFMSVEELEEELAARRMIREREREKYLKAMRQEKLLKLESQLGSLRQQLGAITLPDLPSMD